MATLPYTVDIQLRWGDMDAYGHINNVEYMRLLEQARVVGLSEWFEGTSVDLLATGILVVRQEIEYLGQLAFRMAPIHIEMWVARLSERSFDLGYEVCDSVHDGGRVYARAETTMVCYDPAAGATRPLTEAEHEVFAAHLGPVVPFRRRVTGDDGA